MKYCTEQNGTTSLFGEKVEDYKDGSGLLFANFDFVTGGQF